MNIYKFYNSSGWKKNKNHFEDANLFEDLRLNSKKYVSDCRKRILKFIPKKGNNILDFASGPIQYRDIFYIRKTLITDTVLISQNRQLILQKKNWKKKQILLQ